MLVLWQVLDELINRQVPIAMGCIQYKPPALPEPVNLLAELNKIKWKLECGSFETAFDLHSQVVGIWRQCLVKVCQCLLKVSLCPHPSVLSRSPAALSLVSRYFTATMPSPT